MVLDTRSINERSYLRASEEKWTYFVYREDWILWIRQKFTWTLSELYI